jgi:uncharacterized iron-regulated membrane protein
MRKRLWQLHSWLGLIAGLGLIAIGLSGSLLVFHDEIEGLIHPALTRVSPTPGGRLPYDRLLASANRALPGYEVTGWLVQHDHPSFADVVYVIKHDTNDWLLTTLDPYTGQLLASPRKDTTTFTGWMLELHYTLFANHAGVLIAGVFGAMLFALGITGVWLYRGFWKNVFTFRWRRGARILFSDLHKFTGITSVAFNLVLGFTGAYWNFTHVIGEWSAGAHEDPGIHGRLYADTLSLDALIAEAARKLPGFRTNYLSLPGDLAAPAVTLYGAVEPRSSLRSPYGSYLVFDAQTGSLTSTTDLDNTSAWACVVDAFVPLHYGTFGGIFVKILWGLGGLTPGILAVSGFSIWWLRRKKPFPARPAATA